MGAEILRDGSECIYGVGSFLIYNLPIRNHFAGVIYQPLCYGFIVDNLPI